MGRSVTGAWGLLIQAIRTRTLPPPEAQETVMNDDHPYLEKRWGHKPYRQLRSWGKIAMWLVLIAIACGLILYLAAGQT